MKILYIIDLKYDRFLFISGYRAKSPVFPIKLKIFMEKHIRCIQVMIE